MEHRQLRRRDDIARAIAVADHQKRVGPRKLGGERRPQRTCRKHARVTDAAPPVDDGQGEILDERSILQTVVHDDDAGAVRARRLRAGDAVARHHGRRGAAPAATPRRRPARRCRHEHRPLRTGEAAAIAAAQTKRPFAGRLQHFGQHHRGRRLARAAEREIADAQHRHAGARALPRHPPRGDSAIAGGGRRQQARSQARLAPPEGGLTHCRPADVGEAASDRGRATARCFPARRRARRSSCAQSRQHGRAHPAAPAWSRKRR